MRETSGIALIPSRIGRINYLIRSVLCAVVVCLAAYVIWFLYFQNPDRVGESIIPILVWFFGACFLRLFFMDVPRMRSAGLNPWLLLLILIPGVAVVFQILLLVVPPVAPQNAA